MFSRGGRLLPSIYADGRYIDDVIAIEGESEKVLRKYFEPAEKEFKEKGADSDVHIVIFDEIDAIFRERGKGDGSAANLAYDSVVNALLTKMDGLEEADNIVVIAMTNRKELLDQALLRPVISLRLDPSRIVNVRSFTLLT